MRTKNRMIETDIESELPYAKLPEFKLVRAIVFRGIQDAIGGSGSKRAREKLNRNDIADAKRWINSELDELFSFVWCAQVICSDWQLFVCEVRKLINSQNIDNAVVKRIEKIRRKDVLTSNHCGGDAAKVDNRRAARCSGYTSDARQLELYDFDATSEPVH